MWRWVGLGLVLAAPARAEPVPYEIAMELASGIPMGTINGGPELSSETDGSAVLALDFGYLFDARDALGLTVECGLGHTGAPGNVRLWRVGVFAHRRYDTVAIGVRVGYDRLEIRERYVLQMDPETWGGIELMRPELGVVLHDGPRTNLVAFAALSVGLFLRHDGQPIGGSDEGGGLLHGWMMFGLRASFSPF